MGLIILFVSGEQARRPHLAARCDESNGSPMGVQWEPLAGQVQLSMHKQDAHSTSELGQRARAKELNSNSPPLACLRLAGVGPALEDAKMKKWQASLMRCMRAST